MAFVSRISLPTKLIFGAMNNIFHNSFNVSGHNCEEMKMSYDLMIFLDFSGTSTSKQNYM